MVSNSGSNNLHGSAFEFLEMRLWMQLLRSDGIKASTSGINLAVRGGPIKVDRTFSLLIMRVRVLVKESRV